MHRTTLLASALSVLLVGSASLVFAQSTPAPQSTTTTNTAATHMAMPSHGGAGNHHRMAWRHGMNHQRSGVIGDLHALSRLYEQAGRSKDMAAVYNDVLAHSRDPRVRNYVYHRLARLQAQPADVDQAIATLRKSLDENLANAAKMRSEREQMRSKRQQRHRGDASTPATSAG